RAARWRRAAPRAAGRGPAGATRRRGGCDPGSDEAAPRRSCRLRRPPRRPRRPLRPPRSPSRRESSPPRPPRRRLRPPPSPFRRLLRRPRLRLQCPNLRRLPCPRCLPCLRCLRYLPCPRCRTRSLLGNFPRSSRPPRPARRAVLNRCSARLAAVAVAVHPGLRPPIAVRRALVLVVDARGVVDEGDARHVMRQVEDGTRDVVLLALNLLDLQKKLLLRLENPEALLAQDLHLLAQCREIAFLQRIQLVDQLLAGFAALQQLRYD